jgi:hypothetical protein
MVVGLGQFPMTLTDMIVYMYGDMDLFNIPINFEPMTLFHYWIDLHLLRALGMEPICKSRNFNIFDFVVNFCFYFTLKTHFLLDHY